MHHSRPLLAISLLALMVGTGNAAAQVPQRTVTEDDLKDVKGRIETFFQSLTKPMHDPERAFRELIGDGPLKDRNDDIAKLIEQALTLEARYGAYSGHEMASTKTIGGDLIFLRYLYKGERFPVVFYFTFYRAGPIGGVLRDWSLIALRFDARVEALEK